MELPSRKPLGVTVLGFDSRSHQAFQRLFQSKCGDRVIQTADESADLAIIELDSDNGSSILADQKQRHPRRKLILISDDPQPERESEGIYLRKPVPVGTLLAALDLVSHQLGRLAPILEGADLSATEPDPPAVAGPVVDQLKEFGPATGSVAPGRGIELLDEIGFVDYVGAQSDIDPRDRNELKTAQYDFRRYFQGYLENACRKAVESNRVLQLNTGWKPVTIFPQTREVWVDADDQQFRSFCLVPIHSIADQGFADSDKGPISISPVYDLDVAAEQFADSSKLQRMESLIWKVALWTSAGRIPEGVDLFRPVYLRHWPNFPRLLVFPYALRIASLLSEHPRSLMNLSRALNIRQQYVFAFYSAARSIGLAGQAVRQVDNLFAPPDINVARGGGVLGKVLSIFKR